MQISPNPSYEMLIFDSTPDLLQVDPFRLFEDIPHNQEFGQQPDAPIIVDQSIDDMFSAFLHTDDNPLTHEVSTPTFMGFNDTLKSLALPEVIQQESQEKPSAMLPISSVWHQMATGICSQGVKPTAIPQFPRYKTPLSKLTGESLYLRYWKKYVTGHPGSISLGGKYNFEFAFPISKITIANAPSEYTIKVNDQVKNSKLKYAYEIQVNGKQAGNLSILFHAQNGNTYCMNVCMTKKRTYLQKAEFASQEAFTTLNAEGDLVARPQFTGEKRRLIQQCMALKRTNRKY